MSLYVLLTYCSRPAHILLTHYLYIPIRIVHVLLTYCSSTANLLLNSCSHTAQFLLTYCLIPLRTVSIYIPQGPSWPSSLFLWVIIHPPSLSSPLLQWLLLLGSCNYGDVHVSLTSDSPLHPLLLVLLLSQPLLRNARRPGEAAVRQWGEGPGNGVLWLGY